MPRVFLSRNTEAGTRRAQTRSAHAEQLGELRAAMGAQRQEHQAAVAALEAVSRFRMGIGSPCLR
eukprot:COSAG01_NODE_33905_length_556_cov_2.678337_2_plen_65_part_00